MYRLRLPRRAPAIIQGLSRSASGVVPRLSPAQNLSGETTSSWWSSCLLGHRYKQLKKTVTVAKLKQALRIFKYRILAQARGKIDPSPEGNERFGIYEPFQIGSRRYVLAEVDPYLPRVVFREVASHRTGDQSSAALQSASKTVESTSGNKSGGTASDATPILGQKRIGMAMMLRDGPLTAGA